MDLAVLDPAPLLRLGVIAALGGGRSLSSMEELDEWLAPPRPCYLVVGIGQADEDGWDLLARLHRHGQVSTIAMLAEFTEVAAARALRAGAVHVLPRDAEAHHLREVVHEAARGDVSLSLNALRAAAAAVRPGRSRYLPNDDELGWLRDLGRDETVAVVAASRHMSERALYRRLRELYRKLDVEGRTQALILARDEGWL